MLLLKRNICNLGLMPNRALIKWIFRFHLWWPRVARCISVCLDLLSDPGQQMHVDRTYVFFHCGLQAKKKNVYFPPQQRKVYTKLVSTKLPYTFDSSVIFTLCQRQDFPYICICGQNFLGTHIGGHFKQSLWAPLALLVIVTFCNSELYATNSSFLFL